MLIFKDNITCRLGEVEAVLTLTSSLTKLLPHDDEAGVVWQLEVVDTSHD